MKEIRDLGEGIFRIDASGRTDPFPRFSYLVVDEGRGALIDPGPREDFVATYKLSISRLPIESLSLILLTGETPDACSSLQLWERIGFRGQVLAHWKAALIASAYGGDTPIRPIDSDDETIHFTGSRSLRLINVPGIPTAGSIFCLDERSGTLFTGLLFGSAGAVDENEPDRIAAFHKLMFPRMGDRADIRGILESLNPVRALPRNGPPVQNPQSVARSLFMVPDVVAPTRPASREAYASIIDGANRRLAEVFPASDAAAIPPHSADQADQSDPATMLERYLDDILRAKGFIWLSIVRIPVTHGLAALGLPPPAIFERYGLEIDRSIAGLLNEAGRLRTENLEMQKSIIQASDEQLKDPVTGFYNEAFFEQYLDSIHLPDESAGFPADSVAFIRLDGIQRLNQRFGTKAGDTALKALGQLLLESKRPNAIFFRMNGPLFTCYMQGAVKADAVIHAQELKDLVEKSEAFVDKVTVSAAIVELHEISIDSVDSGKLYGGLMKVGKERLRLLTRLGPNSICSESTITLRRSSGTVLLVEGNAFEADLLRRVLERQGFETHIVTHGSEVLAKADLCRPDVVVSEIFIPQMDGFQIRQRFTASPDLRNVPFILMSRDKSEASVQRALSLGIRHFFKKPVLAVELAGIIKLLINESAGERRP